MIELLFRGYTFIEMYYLACCIAVDISNLPQYIYFKIILNSKSQSGVISTQTGKGTVNFPKSFESAPSVIMTARGTSETVIVSAKISEIRNTGFDYIVQTTDGNNLLLPDYQVFVYWIAHERN